SDPASHERGPRRTGFHRPSSPEPLAAHPPDSMPSNKALPSSPRWPSARRGILLAIALGCLTLLVIRRSAPAQASARGAAPSAARAPRSARRVFVEASPTARTVRRVLDAHGGVIEGRVVDGAGNPVADAHVELVPGAESAAGRAPVL